MKEGGIVTGIRVFHFAGDRLRDGRELPRAGDMLVHKGKVVPCESGLHGSVRALDALSYAPGWNVALCELVGELVPHGSDKHAASERHYLTGYVDAREVVLKWCFAETDWAVRVHTVAALRFAASADGMQGVHRNTLRAKADELERLPVVDSEIAARSAAWSAESAAWSAAASAAWSAAASAAESAAWSAAASAAWSAAASAAWSAAESAAWSAAASAAESAAWSAARSAANNRLEAALYDLLGVRP